MGERARRLRFCKASGVSSAVERQLPKLDVAGSIPVPRSSSPYGTPKNQLQRKKMRHGGEVDAFLPTCPRLEVPRLSYGNSVAASTMTLKLFGNVTLCTVFAEFNGKR